MARHFKKIYEKTSMFFEAGPYRKAKKVTRRKLWKTNSDVIKLSRNEETLL